MAEPLEGTLEGSLIPPTDLFGGLWVVEGCFSQLYKPF